MNCPEGMKCATGSTAAGFSDSTKTSPQLLPGYWTDTSKPLFVYECKPEDVCPGGAPGTCSGKRMGIACGLCPEDHKLDGTDCASCDGGEKASAIIGVILL